MKNLKFIPGLVLAGLLATLPLAGCTDNRAVAEARPYPFSTCLVCDMKLGEMGTPYTFVYEGQQIKVCEKAEKAEFDKDPAKYMKKLAEAEAKLKTQKE